MTRVNNLKSITDEEIYENITHQLETTQTQFDAIKLTVGTAGVLVALSLNESWSTAPPMLLGYSSYKLTLVLVLISMLSVVLSFIVKEFQMLWLDKNFSKVRLSWFQNFLIKAIHKNRVEKFRWYSRFYTYGMNKGVTFFNFSASIALVLSVLSFMYMVIQR